MITLRWFIFTFAAGILPLAAAQTDAIPCGSVWTALSQPWVSTHDIPCLELVIDQSDAGELAFTALAVAPDGTLYAARPLAGEVWAIADENGDGLPETPRLAADGLTLPNGLTYYDDALYISGGAHVYRLRAGELTTLVDSLPSGGGFWTGGIAVGDDGRIYVGSGAPCDACTFEDTGRGAIWRFDADGSNPQMIASGLRFPADLIFHDGALWVVDSGAAVPVEAPDELNRVDVNTTTHFGFPYCIGMENTPTDLASAGGFDCAAVTSPVVTFPNGSQPLGIAAYTSDAMPTLTDGLLVVMGGTTNRTELVGYRVALVYADGIGTYVVPSIIPVDPEPGHPETNFNTEQINYRDSGFWRHRPYDVAVNADGMIYLSVGGGRILALRSLMTN